MSNSSTLNNLRDISLNLSAGTLVGYTESEIKEYFCDHIQALKAELKITDDDVLMNEVRERYNGYRFGLNTTSGTISEPIYNPFAINYVFEDLQFSDKWSISGSASMLSNKLIRQGYSYESWLSTSVEELKSSCKFAEMSLTSLMYHGGYSTIHKYDELTNKVILKIPNKSINKYLAKDYLKSTFSELVTMKVELVATSVHDIMTLTPINEMDTKIKEISKLFDIILDHHYSYIATKDEGSFRNIFDFVFKIGFRDVAFEAQKNGQKDIAIIEKSRIFIIEYKMKNENSIKKEEEKELSNEDPPNKAIEQIKKKEYYSKYSKMNIPILLFGITLKTNNESMKRYIDIQYNIIN
jgi:hypothetical protein